MGTCGNGCVGLKRAGLLVATAALLAASAAAPAGEALAMGSTAHELVSYVVKEKAAGDLKKLLTDQQDSFRNGTIFPDVANRYLGSDEVGWKGGDSADDLSHGEQDGSARGLLNEYLNLIKDRCGRVYKQSEKSECKEARAFFLGILSHVIADGPWHADFIGLQKTKGSIVSVVDKCEGGNGKAHDFADTDVDICLAKRVNEFGSQNMELNPTQEEARFVRKNTAVGQGCSGDSWWHLGGGDGLLGACWKCPDGFDHDIGKTPIQKGVCYKKRTVVCDKLDPDSLGVNIDYLRTISVTASALSFQVVDDGYQYAAETYNRMSGKPGSEGLGGRTSAKGLVKTAKSDEFLPNLTFAHMASKKNLLDAGYAAECGWGLGRAMDHDGGIKLSAFAARTFIDKVWTYLQTDQDFTIHRFGAYNYALKQGDAVRHCVSPNPSKGCL